MLNTFSNTFIIIVLLVTFIGQAMANNTSIFCETELEPHSLIENNQLAKSVNSKLTGPNSSGLTNLNEIENTQDCCDIECCDIDCLCIANACSPYVYLHAEINALNSQFYSETAYFEQPEATNFISTSFFRPPILS